MAAKRHHFAVGINPFPPEASTDRQHQHDVVSTTENSAEETQQGFNKALALVTEHVATPSRHLTRTHERTAADNASEKTAQAVESVKSRVTRLPFNPDLYIEENTIIPCTLQTRFVSDIAGRIRCTIAEDIYSANGHTKLIAKGTKANGLYKTGTFAQGQGRLFIIWTALRTPDHKKIALTDTQGVGPLGEAGIAGWIDTHFWQRFGNALMLSIVQDVAAAAANNTPEKDRHGDHTKNSRTAAAEMAKMALENSINIPPTLYKNQGDIIGILVGEDIDFSHVYTLRL